MAAQGILTGIANIGPIRQLDGFTDPFRRTMFG